MTDGIQPLGFPDAPRSKLDKVLAELVETAQEVLATQGRLRSLLTASRAVSEDLDLSTVLRRIVEAALDLVGAKFGALGVISADGSLEDFVHVGMPDELVRQIGELPRGHGLLGALIEDQVPIRTEHISLDPRSSGFPAHHPPMDSFVGVPVRVRDEIFGNLYLTESNTGSFTDEDQELLIALAATAGAAIDHARLYDESLRRQAWVKASAEVVTALLSEQPDDSLTILAERVAELTSADLVCVSLPTTMTTMTIEIAYGDLAPSFAGTTFVSAGTLAGRALENDGPVLSDTDIQSQINPQIFIGPTLAVPLASSGRPKGVLTVSRLPGRARFTSADLEMAAAFAAQASLAIDLADGRANRQRLAVLEDRGRIARDLHDHVIQRIFGAGLGLQAIAGTIEDPRARRAIVEQVDALDAAIAEIRTAIFTLTTEQHIELPSVRHQIIDLVAEMSGMFVEPPRIAFAGPVDLMVPAAMVDDLVAVVREGLTNVAKHADARDAAVSISVDHGVLSVVIDDDGNGVVVHPDEPKGGTSNLSERAGLHGGQFDLIAREPRGTTLKWTVPIPDEAAMR